MTINLLLRAIHPKCPKHSKAVVNIYLELVDLVTFPIWFVWSICYIYCIGIRLFYCTYLANIQNIYIILICSIYRGEIYILFIGFPHLSWPPIGHWCSDGTGFEDLPSFDVYSMLGRHT